jgi:hypothetical protein
VNLRKAARDMPCTLMLPGCDGGGETTVLAHIRYNSNAGMGQKPIDLHGVRSCAGCHDQIDGRNGTLQRDPESHEAALLRGLLRTLAAYEREGIL